MTQDITRAQSFLQLSIFGKCLLMVAIITGLVAGLMTFNAEALLKDVAHRGLSALAYDSTQSIARDVAGAIKFGKTPAVQSSFDHAIQVEGDKLGGAMAFSANGTVIVTTGTLSDEMRATLTVLAEKALKTGEIATDATGLVVAAPALFGDKKDKVGSVALQWTAAGLEAEYGAQQLKAIFLAVAAFATLLAAGAWFLHRALRLPLNAIAEAMDRVANADFESVIPMTKRRDEVGRIAQSLDIMRHGLGLAEIDRRKRDQEVAIQQSVVKELSTALQGLAHGDLTTRVPPDFPETYRSLGDNFDSAAERLGNAIGAVIATAGKIGREADQISRQSTNLSQRTENQAATLEETAAAMDELTANVNAAANSTREVEAFVQHAQNEASQSGSVVQSAVSAMQEIEKFSDQISTIISVIDDIAFQTNLLALNAGVEAARAGEAGRGFAVVASEVRALAQRSSEAAREIKSLITDSAQQVGKGVDLVGKAGEALSTIASRVQSISGLISGIARGAGAQSTSLNEINIGVSQLDQVTQQNAAMVQDANQTSESLMEEARRLVEMVSVFKIDEAAKTLPRGKRQTRAA